MGRKPRESVIKELQVREAAESIERVLGLGADDDWHTKRNLSSSVFERMRPALIGPYRLYAFRYRPLRGLLDIFITLTWGLRPRLYAVVRFADS